MKWVFLGLAFFSLLVTSHKKKVLVIHQRQ